MNYYRRYIADYGSKTGALSMIEDGAYTRLLDWYYEHEQPLPLVPARIYQIARAMAPAERKAVDHVLKCYFEKREDGWHNVRADEELATALPKLENLRRAAKENGAKGGRPSKTKPKSEPKGKPNPVSISEPNRAPNPEPSSQPLSLSEPPTTAFPVVETSGPWPSTAGGAENPEPTPPTEGRIAGLSALLRKAKVSDVDTARALMERWLGNASDALLVKAVNEACRSKGGHPFVAAYLDPIVERFVADDRRARDNATAKNSRTQAQIAEQRGWTSAPMPEGLSKFKPRTFNAEDAP